MKRFFLAAALVAGLLAAPATQAQVREDGSDLVFEVDLVIGKRQDLLGELITGRVTVDGLLLDANGGSVTIPGGFLFLELSFLPASGLLTEIDDFSFPLFPQFVYEDFAPIEADILFADTPQTPGLFSDPDILALEIFTDLTPIPDGDGFMGFATVISVIPTPASLPLIASGLLTLGVLGGIRRGSKQHA